MYLTMTQNISTTGVSTEDDHKYVTGIPNPGGTPRISSDGHMKSFQFNIQSMLSCYNLH